MVAFIAHFSVDEVNEAKQTIYLRRNILLSKCHKFVEVGYLRVNNLHRWRKMILSMGAGQLDLWSRVSHSHSYHHVSMVT